MPGIADAEYGAGLDDVLRARVTVHRIMNGIDPDLWTPSRDDAIAARFSPGEPPGQARLSA